MIEEKHKIKQCDECCQWYPESEVVDCPFHIYALHPQAKHTERVVTKEGIKTQPESRNRYCSNCAFKHSHEGLLWI